MALNPIAEVDNPDSGIIILPEQAVEIKSDHKFYCPDFSCKDPARRLIAKISSIGTCFFSHVGNYEHEIRPETLLHKLAIKWFLGKDEFELPKCDLGNSILSSQIVKLENSKTQCEFRKLDRLIPDVRLVTEKGFEFAIEIVVTNDISEAKAKLINEFGLPTLRIDLTDFYKQNKQQCQIDLKFIEENLFQLLTNIDLKSWVIKPKQELLTDELVLSEKKDNNGCLGFLLGIGLFFIILKLINKSLSIFK